MKKATFLAAAFLSAALFSSNVYAQDSKKQPDLAVNQTPNATALFGREIPHAPAVSTLSVRAIKDFKSRFRKVQDETWGLTDNGFIVCFTNAGFKIHAYYDRKGNWLASLKYADETQLPFFISDVVKRTYCDLAITHVNIIEVPDRTVYLVHLEDEKTFKIVRVSEEGEMDVLHEYTKAN
jgi:hypothetical protein